MLMMSPHMPFFFFFLLVSSMLCISSSNYVFMWIGLEINLMSFIPLMSYFSYNKEMEAVLKYFLVQALGSSLFLLSVLYMNYSNNEFYFINYFIIMSMLIKVGAAPFHFWVPQVMSCLTWPLCLVLSTWQKLAPLLILSKIINYMNMLFFVICVILSSLVGGLGGLNQVKMRSLLAFSSISHMGWILVSMLMSWSIMLFYYFMYFLMNFMIMMVMYMLHNSSINLMTTYGSNILVMIMVMFLSLGGIPPLVGFAPKWMVLSNMGFFSIFGSWKILLVISLVLGSLLSLYYYLMIIFSINMNMKFLHEMKNNFLFTVMIGLSMIVTGTGLWLVI